MTTNPTTQQPDLDAIQARVDGRRAALSGWLNCYSPLPEMEALEGAEGVLQEDVPRLVAEIHRLRAELAAARSETFREAAAHTSECCAIRLRRLAEDAVRPGPAA